MSRVSTERLRAAAQGLVVDRRAADVLGSLAAAGVPALLLKGATVAELLHDAHEPRTYNDVDVLVGPDRVQDAGRVLASLGYRPVAAPASVGRHRPTHATEWERPGDVSVDLHRRLSGVGADPDAAWAVLASRARPFRLAGAEVPAVDPVAVALLVGLHPAHHGPSHARSLADLDRALDRLTGEDWDAVAALARALDAEAALGAGLRLRPGGAALAARLDLPERAPLDVALRSSGAPPLALGLDWLARTPGLRARAALVARTALPTPGALRIWRPLARRGPGGLALAYASHPLWLARHALPSLLALRRARRAAA
ncbi:MAG: nucleotidyltransferase family protein [Thermoleophilia bacterium]